MCHETFASLLPNKYSIYGTVKHTYINTNTDMNTRVLREKKGALSKSHMIEVINI